MSNSLTKRVDFNIIRYANCWEDADILLEGLQPRAGDKILSVGSAGDNSFALLTSNPSVVVAVDVNRIQLYLIELKKAGIKRLDYASLLSFLGFTASTQREKYFDAIKEALSVDARKYWEANRHLIRDGVIYAGKFEQYFKLFSQKILPFIHSKETVAALLHAKPASAQQAFYQHKWNTWRWRLLFKLFFSKYVMGKYGRDPEFLKEVDISVSDYIFQKAGKHLQSTLCQDNFILHFNLTGNFGNLLPNYLTKENFTLIQSNIDAVEIKQGYAQDVIQKYGTFNCMNLSNIFEYMDNDTFKNTAEALIQGAAKDCTMAYWNLMVPRRIAEICPNSVAYQQDLSLTLSEKDKGFFYKQLIIDKVI